MSEVDSRNEVEIDLEKYDTLINNLHDKEKEIARMKADAEAQKKAIGPRKKRRVLDIFLDDKKDELKENENGNRMTDYEKENSSQLP